MKLEPVERLNEFRFRSLISPLDVRERNKVRSHLFKLILIITMFNFISHLFGDSKWEKINMKSLGLHQPILHHEKEWKAASDEAIKEKTENQISLSIERNYREKFDESSTSVSCGLVGNYPSIGIEITASVHYFFKGTECPSQLGENFTITLSSKIMDDSKLFRRRDVSIVTEKNTRFIPDTEGIGAYNDGKATSIALVKLNEKECRRLLEDEIESIMIGVLTITHSESIKEGLSLLIDDLDSRRNEQLEPVR